MDDPLEQRFADARLSAVSVEAQVQRAELRARMFHEPPRPVHVGRFAIEGTLGAGGMGRVYAARDPQLDRPVAIKVLRAGVTQERLAREARAMARINHPNVVPVFDVGRTGEDELFVAMELVDGDTLADRLGHPQALPLLLQAGRGLLAAHEAGVLHRDFKPSNVLVTRDGIAKVTDFGLAASPHGAKPAASAAMREDGSTLTGSVLGTPAYMAPEQRAGTVVDAAADQFAFCALAPRGLN